MTAAQGGTPVPRRSGGGTGVPLRLPPSSGTARALAPPDLSGPFAPLRDVGHVRRFPRHAALVGQAQFTDRLLVLLAGRVKEHHVAPEGRELVLALRGPGDLVGNIPPHASLALAAVTALETVDALVVEGAQVAQALVGSPVLRAAVAKVTAERLEEARRAVVEMWSCSATTRIARRLLDLANRWGRREDGLVQVDLLLTQEELGAWAGLSREATVKALAELRRARVVVTSRRHIEIHDLPGLTRWAGWPGDAPV